MSCLVRLSQRRPLQLARDTLRAEQGGSAIRQKLLEALRSWIVMFDHPSWADGQLPITVQLFWPPKIEGKASEVRTHAWTSLDLAIIGSLPCNFTREQRNVCSCSFVTTITAVHRLQHPTHYCCAPSLEFIVLVNGWLWEW